MKKIIVFIFNLMTLYTQAQNTFPSTGNVGIGTIDPKQALHVKSTNQLIANFENPSTGTTDQTDAFTLFTNKYGSSQISSWQNFGTRIGSRTIATGGIGNVYFTTDNDAVRMFIQASTGNVGIGTIDPKHPLHIKTTNQFVANFENSSTGTTDQTDAFTLFTNKYGSSQISSWQNFGTRIGSRITTAGGMGNVYFTTGNDIVRVIIKEGNGNVGIGTTNPTQKLSVNGTIQAKEIVVNTGWSDFVFDDNYKLRSLKEVEQFIKLNKHLPEIPSQQQVDKNGVQLGDISSKLLMKIEELTLYMIEMKKEMETLKKENTELKSSNFKTKN